MHEDLVSGGAPLWYVSATWSGEAVAPLLLRSSLLSLTEERPFLSALRFTATTVQLEYWDEGATLDQVAHLAVRLWSDHQRSCSLPAWDLVALDVVAQSEHLAGKAGPPVLANSQDLNPLGL